MGKSSTGKLPICPKCGKPAESVSKNQAIHKSHIVTVAGIQFRQVDEHCYLGGPKDAKD